jgi:transmembrane sensor
MKSSRNYTDQGENPAWGPADEAALWALRHDRGLTAAEQDEFSQWLAADPRHGMAWAEHRWGWDELDRLAGLQTSVHAVPDPDLLARRSILSWSNGLAPRGRKVLRFALPVLAAAAVLTLGLFVWTSRPVTPVLPETPPVVRSLALIEQRTLSDGSTIELNRGAVVTEHYSAGERRVRLVRGEAHFTVAKDAVRPFFVEAGGVTVRAVGTAFNIRLDPASVEVLVTEGKVQVGAVAPNRPDGRAVEGNGPYLNANERTVVSFAPSAPPPQVAAVPPAEIEARLAWQPRLLDFTDAPLAEIVAEFNRRNPVRLVLTDTGLAGKRLSATFRSDNVEGFVRLMESDFGMKAEWRADDEIVLTRTQ